MVDNQALRSMALGAMVVVAVSILTATTLLPALIALLGDRVLPGGVVGRVLRRMRRGGGGDFWVSWTRRVMARPWLSLLGAAAVLLVLAAPVLSLSTGTEALGQFPKGSDVRVGNELASARLGGGTDPIEIVAEFDGAGVDRAALGAYV
jgi:RND superfamily putative drug exporter